MTNRSSLNIDQLLEEIKVEPKSKKASFHETHTAVTFWLPNEAELKYKTAQDRDGGASKEIVELLTKFIFRRY